MFRLKTLGTLDLQGQSGPPPAAATQKRRLALLAIVAGHAPAGIPREKAALLLWPENDSDSARHSLSQLLYSIRQSLGVDPFVSIAGNLKLDPEVIISDLDELEIAIRDNDPQRISDLYTGKFLDGFNLSESTEFERWVDVERSRRNSQVVGQLERYASELSTSGQYSDAAEWWKKLAAIEPLDSRIAAELIKSLDAAGNRPGALQHANIHASLVRSELEIEPDQVITELERRLRTPVAPQPPVVADMTPTRDFAKSPATNPASHGADRQESTKKPNRMTGVAGALFVVAVVFVSASIVRLETRPDRVPGTAVAVLPFTVHSDSSIAYLREGLTGLLSSDLDGAGDLRTVDPRALLRYSAGKPDIDQPSRAADISRHFDAAMFVIGDVSEAGGKLRISAGLFNRASPDEPISSATVEGERSRLFALVDDLASKLLAGRYKRPQERLINSAAVTTRSVAALKEYLTGEQELRASRYAAAMQAFERATKLDTTFALAFYRMSVSAEWEGRPDIESTAAARALALSSRLSDHDRKLVEALAARRDRNPDKAEMIYRQIVKEFPDDAEAWYQLGEVLFHDNAMRGRSFVESREAWEHVLHYVPSDADALLHLSRVLARSGPPKLLDSVVTASLPFLTGSQRLETEALRAFTIGSRVSQDSILARMRSVSHDAVWQILWRVAVYPRNLEGARRTSNLLLEPSRPTVSKSIGHTANALLLLAQGKIVRASEEDANVARAFPWSKDVDNIYFRSLGFTKNDPTALRRLRSAFDAWRPAPVDKSLLLSNPHGVLASQYKMYAPGLLSVALNEPLAAIDYAKRIRGDTAFNAVGSIPSLFAVVTEAAALRQSGKPREALSLIESWRGSIPIEVGAALGVESYYGWLRAELLNENGRDLDGLKWYESRADLFVNELIYLAPASLRAASIYEKRGNRAKAIASYNQFIALWKDADPELQPFVTHARERLKLLTR